MPTVLPTTAGGLPATPLADRATLQRCLQRICSQHFGDETTVTELQQRSLNSSTCYASEVVTAQLNNGRELKLFLKNFGWQMKPRDEVRPRAERETRVYRDLLASAELGTPRYYGSVRDDAASHFLLLLELVEGQPLRYCDFMYWIDAAAWLGRMHAHFATRMERIDACEFLLRHDSAIFHSKAALARSAVRQVSATLAARLERTLAAYEATIDRLAGPPLTLLHGGYRPKNIVVVAPSAAPTRICPIDWEMAAVGSSVFDFAALSDGFAAPQLDRLCAAYRDAATSQQFAVPAHSELLHLVHCFRLHRTIIRLGGAVTKRYNETRLTQIVADAEHRSRLVWS